MRLLRTLTLVLVGTFLVLAPGASAREPDPDPNDPLDPDEVDPQLVWESADEVQGELPLSIWYQCIDSPPSSLLYRLKCD